MRFLLTADWHLRADRPKCRTEEDWIGAQMDVVRWIVDKANEERVPLFICGDIFHQPRAATEIVNRTIQELKRARDGVYLLAGNHDLPFHSMENIDRSSIGTLLQCFRSLTDYPDIDAAHFGQDNPQGRKIAFVHRLVMPQSKLAELAGATSIEQIAEEFPRAENVCCGDYHHHFMEDIKRQDGTVCRVINSGCITVQAADMIDYNPSVILFDSEDLIERLEIPQEPQFAVEYLAEEKARETRAGKFFDSFVKQNGALSFRENLEKRLSGEVSTGCRHVIEEVIDVVYPQK